MKQAGGGRSRISLYEETKFVSIATKPAAVAGYAYSGHFADAAVASYSYRGCYADAVNSRTLKEGYFFLEARIQRHKMCIAFRRLDISRNRVWWGMLLTESVPAKPCSGNKIQTFGAVIDCGLLEDSLVGNNLNGVVMVWM